MSGRYTGIPLPEAGRADLLHSALFIQGTSSTAGITMPILGAVAMTLFADSSIGAEGGKMMLISAFTLGLNFTASGLYPEATKMGDNSRGNIG